MKLGCLTTSDTQLTALSELASKSQSSVWQTSSFEEFTTKVGGLDVLVDTRSRIPYHELAFYAGLNGKEIWLNTTRTSVKGLMLQCGRPVFAVFCGITAWPGFLSSEPLEISVGRLSDRPLVKETLATLGISSTFVPDRPGMVRARILAMIINEAYYALQEGTSTKPEIDLAMKLGTNYPHGPFAWADLIGKDELCGLLDALRSETGDGRYAVAALLREEAQVELLENVQS